MQVRFRKSQLNAKTPTRATEGSAGWDLYVQRTSGTVCYTGIHIEIPIGYVGLLFPRSSISNKKLLLANSVGVIDSDFRGEIQLMFYKIEWDGNEGYEPGNRCGQLIIIPKPDIEWVEVDELSDTKRGDGGFGSTGS